jgi:hypothetical protein
MTASAKTLRASRRYVYLVTYHYDYEGHDIQAVYASQKLADQHPKGGDETVVHKMRVHGAAVLKRKRTGRR